MQENLKAIQEFIDHVNLFAEETMTKKSLILFQNAMQNQANILTNKLLKDKEAK
jgi:hypothetical protein